MSTVIKYCDRCVLLNAGDKIAEGNPNDIVDIYKKVMVGQWERENNPDSVNILESKEDTWMSQIITNPHMNVYGNMKAQIIDFGVFDEAGNLTNNIYKGDYYTIKVRIRINQHIDQPIFTYKLKDIKGNELTGTNTMYEHIDTSNIKPGEIAEVSFRQKQLLQPGQYLLSIGCTGYEGDIFVVYNRVYDACNVGVVSERTTVGFFDSLSEVNVKILKGNEV